MNISVIVLTIFFVALAAAVVCRRRAAFAPQQRKENFGDGVDTLNWTNCEKKHYRCGDIIKSNKHRNLLGKYHRECYPNSIAVEYMKRTQHEKDYNTLIDIINSRKVKGPGRFTLVVHLRCGDVLEKSPYSVEEHLRKNRKYKNGLFYVKTRNYYNRIISIIRNYDIRNVEIVSYYHNSKRYPKSIEYITKIRNIFSKKYITKIISGREPDFDLSYMSKSKYFVQSGGGFSRIIADLVKVNNGIVLN